MNKNERFSNKIFRDFMTVVLIINITCTVHLIRFTLVLAVNNKL